MTRSITRFFSPALVSLTLACGLASTAAFGATEPGNRMCLRAIEIDHTTTLDAKTILFHMRDGNVWRNTLRSPCNDLKFSGYVEEIRGGTICANQQLLRTIETGKTCRLGDFSLEKDAAKTVN
jgi:hypothetical protein